MVIQLLIYALIAFAIAAGAAAFDLSKKPPQHRSSQGS